MLRVGNRLRLLMRGLLQPFLAEARRSHWECLSEALAPAQRTLKQNSRAQ